MPFFLSDNELQFPPVDTADPDGLLAIGGDLSPNRLLLAYRKGIFPWYDEGLPLWWCPDPRFVLFPEELRIRKSVRKLLDNNQFEFTVNKAFTEVINLCRKIERPNQAGTWIGSEIVEAYCRLHTLGFAHSAEVWKDGELAGGLYGIRLGNVFFGESMFSRVSEASRYAFITYVQMLMQEGVALVDCQVYTAYLESFGARMISRKAFTGILQQQIREK